MRKGKSRNSKKLADPSVRAITSALQEAQEYHIAAFRKPLREIETAIKAVKQK